MASKRVLISTQRPEVSTVSARAKRSVVDTLEELLPAWQESTAKAEELDRWYYSELHPTDLPLAPRRVPAGVADLKETSISPWAKMICDSASQDLIVDGFRGGQNQMLPAVQRRWQQNGLDARQRAVHDGVVRHGKAFNLIGKAVGRLDGKPTAFIRGKSARHADAFFRDDFDEWPEFFLEGHQQKNVEGDTVWRFDLYDDVYHYWLSGDLSGKGKVEYIAQEEHEMGVTPAVRATVNLDLAGRAIGEIEPYIYLFKRLNQDNFDRLVVQRFGAHVIRWLAGIAKPSLQSEADAAALALAVTDLLMIENPQGKAGTLPATPLDGYLRARENDVRDLSAVSQVASFNMLGLSDNVGAEGLAAAKHAHTLKLNLFKQSLGEFWEASNRLAGHAAGDAQAAEDFETKAHWKDNTAQSFQGLTQGLAMLAEKLEIAPEMLWGRIPNWDDSDTRQAITLREQRKEEERAEAELAAEMDAARQVEIQQARGASGGNAGAATS